MEAKIEILKAHNGLPTAKVNGIPLHSSYDPIKEAQRIIEQTACNFTPAYIFVPIVRSFLEKHIRKQNYMHFILQNFFPPQTHLGIKLFTVRTIFQFQIKFLTAWGMKELSHVFFGVGQAVKKLLLQKLQKYGTK